MNVNYYVGVVRTQSSRAEQLWKGFYRTYMYMRIYMDVIYKNEANVKLSKQQFRLIAFLDEENY